MVHIDCLYGPSGFTRCSSAAPISSRARICGGTCASLMKTSGTRDPINFAQALEFTALRTPRVTARFRVLWNICAWRKSSGSALSDSVSWPAKQGPKAIGRVSKHICLHSHTPSLDVCTHPPRQPDVHPNSSWFNR